MLIESTLSEYQNFLLELENYYPVISGVKIQESTETDSDKKSAEEMMNKYKCLQYYTMFDWED